MPILRSYGAKPSPFDPRDFRYSRLSTPQARPSKGSAAKPGEPVFNQGDEGSCVINAMAGAIEHLIPGFVLSRSYSYYKTRVAQHDVHQDDGCDPRTALETLRKHGSPPEKDWAYDGLEPDKSKFFAKVPPHNVNLEAKKLVLEEYQALGQTAGMLNDILDCIGNKGLPVMIGIAVYSSFEGDTVAQTGKVPLPGRNEQMLGYHETLAEEYDDASRLIKVRNSWDRDWGDGGYFYLPYDYASNIKLLTDANVVIGAKLS